MCAAPAADLKHLADGIRLRVLEHVLANGEGYLSQACSSAEILALLYGSLLRLGPTDSPLLPPPFSGTPGPANSRATSGAAFNGPAGPHLDRFIFSPVHYALVLYATLVETGRMAPAGLNQFNQDGSTVEMIGAEHSPGHEITAGSLAQALSVAAGMALARRLKGDTGRVWVFLSDGEFQEGQTWEALNAAAWYGLGNLGVFVDANGQQCDGAMTSVMNVEPLGARLRAFGVDLAEVDGHDLAAMQAAVHGWTAQRPLVVLARTDPCRGLEEVLRPRAPKLHYVRFADDGERTAGEHAATRLRRGRP